MSREWWCAVEEKHRNRIRVRVRVIWMELR